VSFVVYLTIALGLVFGWGWNADPVAYFEEAATLGAILIVLTWLTANLALPLYYRREHRDEFSWIRHLVLPLLGVVAIGAPLNHLLKPGQPAPFNTFPMVSGIIVAVALLCAVILNACGRTLGERVGSIIADAE
jgi:hypothetical protein